MAPCLWRKLLILTCARIKFVLMVIVLIVIPRTPGRDWGFGAVFWVGGGGRQLNVFWSSISVPLRLLPWADISTPPGQDPYVGQTRARCPYFEHLKHWESLLLHVTAVFPVPRHNWHEISSKLARGAMGIEEGMWRVGVGGRVGMSMSVVGTVLAWDRVGPWKRACLIVCCYDVMSGWRLLRGAVRGPWWWLRTLIGLGGPCGCDLAFWAWGGGFGLRWRNFLVTVCQKE